MQLIHSLISKTQKSTAQIRSRLRIDKYKRDNDFVKEIESEV
jgi:hypothetical protein